MDIADILSRKSDPHRPSLENRVAYQWEEQKDTLSYHNGVKRDNIILNSLTETIQQSSLPATVLDIGCAYGNMLLMLNALLGKPSNVELVGVDLAEDGLAFARAFVEHVPGYQNCKFRCADLSRGLPFKDATFNAISIADVLEHIKNPIDALKEIVRVAKPGAVIIICVPLRGSIFKKLAHLINKFSRGRLFQLYYKGKYVELDDAGKPIMPTKAGGYDHISEMTYKELKRSVISVGLKLERVWLMPIMSGSRWFDKHRFLLAALLFFEAIHDVLQRPSWAHGVCMKLKVPASLKIKINND